MNQFWTPANVAELRALAATGHRAAQIALKLKTTRSAICAKANRLGVPLYGQPSPRNARQVRAPEHKPYAKSACFDGANLADPNRADKLLRRFSWDGP